MSNFWDKIKKLFSESEQSSPSQPAIRQMIERSEEEKADYIQWKKTLARRRLLDWLNDQYLQFMGPSDHFDEAIDFLHTPSSKGFVIHFYQTRYTPREITHFFDFLKEKVLTLDYSSYVSDSRTYNRPKWVETVQRHYLKPKILRQAAAQQKIDQRFGNITIELLLRNDQIHQLKFRATTYQDHKFKEAGAFSDLMQSLMV
ncbi:MAG: hypothetical protein AAF985_23025 [Bacteroidota bacterium]